MMAVPRVTSWGEVWAESPDETGRVGPQEGYGISGVATGEELALIRVLGIALILLLIMAGMAVSQFVICLLTCTDALHFSHHI
jgi:hypothetical protein